uniref:Bm14454 n=1 Tax=Brugia malayi TaxID=6279 RepID=A0A1I9G0X2_BRUMA|nr:Bm14454 [Brugia malayi]
MKYRNSLTLCQKNYLCLNELLYHRLSNQEICKAEIKLQL